MRIRVAGAISGAKAEVQALLDVITTGAPLVRQAMLAGSATVLLYRDASDLEDLDHDMWLRALTDSASLQAAIDRGAASALIDQAARTLLADIQGLEGAETRWAQQGALFEIAHLAAAPQGTVTVPIHISGNGSTPLGPYEIDLAYDPNVLRVQDVQFMIGNGATFVDLKGVLHLQGNIQGIPPLGSSFDVAHVRLQAIGVEGRSSPLVLHRLRLATTLGAAMPVIGADGSVVVQRPTPPPPPKSPVSWAGRALLVGLVLYAALRIYQWLRGRRPQPSVEVAAPATAAVASSSEVSAPSAEGAGVPAEMDAAIPEAAVQPPAPDVGAPPIPLPAVETRAPDALPPPVPPPEPAPPPPLPPLEAPPSRPA